MVDALSKIIIEMHEALMIDAALLVYSIQGSLRCFSSPLLEFSLFQCWDRLTSYASLIAALRFGLLALDAIMGFSQ